MKKFILAFLLLTLFSNANNVFNYVKSRIETAAVCKYNNVDVSVNRVSISNAETIDGEIIVTGTVYLQDISSKSMQLFTALTNTQESLSKKFRAKFTKVLDSVTLNCFATLEYNDKSNDKYCTKWVFDSFKNCTD